jgi:inorganic pyrophosphatase
VLEYYAVESIEDLNGDQIAEIEQFREEYNEYSVMQIGFSNLLSEYESAHG